MALSAHAINYKDGTDTTVTVVANPSIDGVDVTINIPSTSFTRLNTLTAKGDLYVATATATVARLAVGSNGTVLKADSGQTAGVKWEAVKDSEVTFTDITTNNATSGQHGFLRKLDGVSTHFLDGTGAWSAVVITEAGLSLSDVTTDDVTTLRHGFVPKAPGDATKVLLGDGTWGDSPVGDPATDTEVWMPLFDSDGALVLDGDGGLIPTLIPI